MDNANKIENHVECKTITKLSYCESYCETDVCAEVVKESCSCCNKMFCNRCFIFNFCGNQKLAHIFLTVQWQLLFVLPPFLNNKKRLLVVLDLDQTLLHSEHIMDILESPIYRQVQPSFKINEGLIGVFLRPYVFTFLKSVMMNYDVAIWTSATKSYCDEIINHLPINKNKLMFIKSRNQCTNVFESKTMSFKTAKDITNITQRNDYNRIVMIDDKEYTFTKNMDNGLLIPQFNQPEQQSNDFTLLYLLKYLQYLNRQEDVRKIDKSNWLKTTGVLSILDSLNKKKS